MALPATLEDKERIESQIIAALSDDPRLTMRDAAKAVGVSRSCLYRMLDANPAMADRIKQARQIARRCVTEDVEQSLVDRAIDPKNLGGVTAAIFLLKGNDPARYGDKPAKVAAHVTVNIDKAQISLAGQTVDEMRLLEAPDELGLGVAGDTTELGLDESDTWVVKQ